MTGAERKGNATERLQILYRNRRTRDEFGSHSRLRALSLKPQRVVARGTPIRGDSKRIEESRRTTELYRKLLKP